MTERTLILIKPDGVANGHVGDIIARIERKGLKLYIKRVFVMDAAEELLPNYLRFVRGVVDADDLPLNVSREILQQNRQLDRIKGACVKRVLDMIEGVRSRGLAGALDGRR